MAWLAGLLAVLLIFWVLGKITGKKVFSEFPERIGLNWLLIVLMLALLLVIIYLTLR